jgi:hypothetical protein
MAGEAYAMHACFEGISDTFCDMQLMSTVVIFALAAIAFVLQQVLGESPKEKKVRVKNEKEEE